MAKTAEMLAKSLAQLMRKGSVKKAHLADAVQISRAHLDHLLEGTANPRLDEIERLAAHFKLKPYELIRPSLPKAHDADADDSPPSEFLQRIGNQIQQLRAKIEGIPSDVLDLLVNRDEVTYETIRELLEEEAEEVEKSLRKKS